MHTGSKWTKTIRYHVDMLHIYVGLRIHEERRPLICCAGMVLSGMVTGTGEEIDVFLCTGKVRTISEKKQCTITLDPLFYCTKQEQIHCH